MRRTHISTGLVALAIDAWAPIRDNSFLWHIRAGELQAQAGEVLVADPFSFTMLGEPWLTQSWLVELLYAWAEGLTGLGFVPYMILLVGGLTFVGVGLAARGSNAGATAPAPLAALAADPSAQQRALDQLMGYIERETHIRLE